MISHKTNTKANGISYQLFNRHDGKSLNMIQSVELAVNKSLATRRPDWMEEAHIYCNSLLTNLLTLNSHNNCRTLMLPRRVGRGDYNIAD